MAKAPSGKRTKVRGVLDVGNLDVEAEIRELRARVNNVEKSLTTIQAEGGVDDDTGIPLPELPSGLLTRAQADELYATIEHSHPTLPTVSQKNGLINISGSNLAVGTQDIAGLLALQTLLRIGFLFKENVPAGNSTFLEVTSLLLDQVVSNPPVQMTGLVLNERVFINEALSRRPIENNTFVVYGTLRQSIPFVYGPPTVNATTLQAAYVANTHTYVLATSSFVTVSNFLVVPTVPGGPEVGTVTSLTGNTAGLSPSEGTGADGLALGTKIYKPLAGWGLVKAEAGYWGSGDTQGRILGMVPTEVQKLAPGDIVLINPGGLNEETAIVQAIVYGATARDVHTVTFEDPLTVAHSANEVIVRRTLAPQIPQPRRLFLDFWVREVGGGIVPHTMGNELIELMIPITFLLTAVPKNNILEMAKFLHSAGDSGGAPTGNPPTALIEHIGSGTFAGQGLPVTLIHNLNLNLYAVMLTIRYNTTTASVGAFGVDLGSVTPDEFQVVNLGESNTKQFNFAVFTIPPAAVIPPLLASGIGTFSAGGTVITHNQGVTPAQCFITVEPLVDPNIASIGAFGVDNVQANTFTVKETGSNTTSQFRWALFDTSALPANELKGFGTGTFAGDGTPSLVTHNLGLVGSYFVKIVPKYGPNLAAVGEYSVDPATMASNSFEVRNTGVDNTTQFTWAVFKI